MVETPEGEEKLSADQVLLAASFVPNSNNLGLEKVGVELDQKGFVKISDAMETNVSGISAIGDVTGKLMLAHVGMAMGMACAEAIAGHVVPGFESVTCPGRPTATPGCILWTDRRGCQAGRL